MKILRSVTRRGFSVGTAGWFTVLRPTEWFAASRLPDRFRHRSSQSKMAEAPERNAFNHLDSQGAAVFSQTSRLSTRDRGLMRPALVVLAATAITSLMLWWIQHP